MGSKSSAPKEPYIILIKQRDKLQHLLQYYTENPYLDNSTTRIKKLNKINNKYREICKMYRSIPVPSREYDMMTAEEQEVANYVVYLKKCIERLLSDIDAMNSSKEYLLEPKILVTRKYATCIVNPRRCTIEWLRQESPITRLATPISNYDYLSPKIITLKIGRRTQDIYGYRVIGEYRKKYLYIEKDPHAYRYTGNLYIVRAAINSDSKDEILQKIFIQNNIRYTHMNSIQLNDGLIFIIAIGEKYIQTLMIDLETMCEIYSIRSIAFDLGSWANMTLETQIIPFTPEEKLRVKRIIMDGSSKELINDISLIIVSYLIN
ncbi:MAG: hypothetical protein Hyperionvirus2_220 [Hyperionvirus sp.]|uniref:Uncharacterized protein n=1 Tax=Hyperionvirus sp. TaxID=2487770 RepID=A0A3G5A739_9VIRU|nr:MAG: hypothetical protein Hyperionvirus2_220 [Hyperionvirus sp.]